MQQLLFDFPPGGRIQVHAKWHIKAIESFTETVVAEWDEEPPDVDVVRGHN
jgi:hypothetical protein